MPHGMFRQELLAEALETEAATPAMRASLDVLLPGAAVVVAGLVKLPAFNGCRGLVQSYDAEAERYTVKLFSLEGEWVAKVRRENLRHSSELPVLLAPPSLSPRPSGSLLEAIAIMELGAKIPVLTSWEALAIIELSPPR